MLAYAAQKILSPFHADGALPKCHMLVSFQAFCETTHREQPGMHYYASSKLPAGLASYGLIWTDIHLPTGAFRGLQGSQKVVVPSVQPRVRVILPIGGIADRPGSYDVCRRAALPTPHQFTSHLCFTTTRNREDTYHLESFKVSNFEVITYCCLFCTNSSFRLILLRACFIEHQLKHFAGQWVVILMLEVDLWRATPAPGEHEARRGFQLYRLGRGLSVYTHLAYP